MEVTEKYLKNKVQLYRDAAEKHKLNAIANDGAADAIELILKDMSIQEVEEKPKEVVDGKN